MIRLKVCNPNKCLAKEIEDKDTTGSSTSEAAKKPVPEKKEPTGESESIIFQFQITDTNVVNIIREDKMRSRASRIYVHAPLAVAVKEAEKPKPEEPQDPKTNKILVGTEVTIEFQKDKDEVIGFFIAGGYDTPSVRIRR